MDALLLIDFGSTYTKITAIDVQGEKIIATSKALTTVDSDIMIGFHQAFENLQREIFPAEIRVTEKLACSSAAGGLKMVAIGLAPELTSEAAKRAALGAGARIMDVFSFQLTSFEVEKIRNQKPDIILLAGGTDGGNQDCIIHNAKVIARNFKSTPVVVAGNKNAVDIIDKIFKKNKMDYQIVDNVMPKINQLVVEPAREAIREFFIERIVRAKGFTKVETWLDDIIMPTPAAVLKAATFLSEGSDREEGIGDLIVVDIGGATTDIHSVATGDPTKPYAVVSGLEEPYAKRTVEGDLGIRVSAESIFHTVSSKKILKYAPNIKFDIKERCEYLSKNVDEIPKNFPEKEFDEALSKVVTEIAIERHVGVIEEYYTPMGKLYTQVGKDLTNVKYLIGTGGPIVHSVHPYEILKAGIGIYDKSRYLKPLNPNILIDSSYILSAMGLMGQKYPDKAVRMLKRYLLQAEEAHNAKEA